MGKQADLGKDPVHLVLGDSAAGVLSAAMARGAPAAAPVVRFRDLYCLGPLDALGTPAGAASRAAYWGRLLPAAPPSVDEFDDEEARYARIREVAAAATLFVWVGAHASSRLWLERVCAVLATQPVDLRVVEAVEACAGAGSRRTLSQFVPREVGRLFARVRRLDAAEIASLARAWAANAAVPSGLRRWSDGRIGHHPDDYYDQLLLFQCDDDWQPAEQAIGSAQWQCDEFLGDVFFAWRLRCLAQVGRVQWRGPLERPADAMVRLAGPGGESAATH
jgi:hypothetical protein